MNMFPQHPTIVKTLKKNNVFSEKKSIKRIIDFNIVAVTTNNDKINHIKIAS